MKDGQQYLGRVINANEKELQMMLVGNNIITLSRNDIEKSEDEKKSLMYEGLIRNMPEDKVNALLDYLMSLSGE
jgi:hypothetical protein